MVNRKTSRHKKEKRGRYAASVFVRPLPAPLFALACRFIAPTRLSTPSLSTMTRVSLLCRGRQAKISRPRPSLRGLRRWCSTGVASYILVELRLSPKRHERLDLSSKAPNMTNLQTTQTSTNHPNPKRIQFERLGSLLSLKV